MTGSQTPVTVTAKGTERITATFAPISGIHSDDFGSCEIDEAWTFINPKNDAEYNRIDNQKLAIVVPGDVEHDVYPNGVAGDPINRAPRLMQPAANVDFEIEAKFESNMSARYQLQGLLVEQDADDFLRFDFNHNGLTPAITVIGFTNGVPRTYGREEIVIAAPMYMRVNRNSDAWTVAHSANGTDWTTAITFTRSLEVNQVGFFAGNAGLNPPHTAIIDYFFENRNRIDPEDGSGSQLTLDKTGNGTVTASPSKQIYGCDEQVQIQATAAAGWTFTGWSGGLTGSQNPATVTMSSSKTVTAIFKQNQFSLNLELDGGEGNETPGTTTASVAGPYYEGQVVTLAAVPQTGYRFTKWISGENEYTEAEIEVTISANATFTAVFEKIPVSEVMHKIYMPIVAR